jgi:rubrerythrin
VTDHVDETELRDLCEKSQDLHHDTMATFARPLEEWSLDEGARRRGISTAALAAATAAGLTLAAALPASAAEGTRTDIDALQTAASIENLAVATYTAALGLTFITNATVAAFAKTTLAQHKDHARAFTSAVVNLGGKAQTGTDPKYAAVVKKALPTLTGYGPVVRLALALENVAAQTYTANVSQVSSPDLRGLFGSVAPVEAQHAAVLLAVQALLNAKAPQLIELSPTVVAKLPAAAGTVGIPYSFYPTSEASPVTEGART